jgi:hypothetical protein
MKIFVPPKCYFLQLRSSGENISRMKKIREMKIPPDETDKGFPLFTENPVYAAQIRYSCQFVTQDNTEYGSIKALQRLISGCDVNPRICHHSDYRTVSPQ